MPAWQPAGGTHARVITLASARVSEVQFAPSLRLPIHEHERDTVAVTLSGGYETIARVSDESPAGTASIEPAGDRHSCRFGPGGARVLVIQPLGEGVLDACKALFRRRSSLRDRSLAAAALRIGGELRRPDSSTPLVIEGLALEILGSGARSSAPDGSGRRPPWLERAEELLRANLHAPIRLGELAREAGVHPVHLQRVFRAQYGTTIGAYHRGLRLDRAALCIASGEAPLIDIALDAGFVDQSHFTRAFVRAFGLTPGRYRRQFRR